MSINEIQESGIWGHTLFNYKSVCPQIPKVCVPGFADVAEDVYEQVQGAPPKEFCDAVKKGIWGKRRPQDAASEVIQKLGEKIDTELEAYCSSSVNYTGNGVKVAIDNDKVVISVGKGEVEAAGFSLNGMDFCYPSSLQVGLELTFKLDDSTLVLEEAAFDFSKPVIGAANFIIGAGAAISLANITVSPYDHAKAADGVVGPLGQVRPMVLVFDRLQLKKDVKDGNECGIYPAVTRYKTGTWASYVFGSTEKDCNTKFKGFTPAEFMGDGYAGDGLGKGECRYPQLGPRTSEIMRSWMFKTDAWKQSYKEYLVMSDNDPVGAMFWLATNYMLTSGPRGKCNYAALEKEVEKLGGEYRKWKGN